MLVKVFNKYKQLLLNEKVGNISFGEQYRLYIFNTVGGLGVLELCRRKETILRQIYPGEMYS